MGKKQLRNEMMYQVTMSMARRMMENGLITADEYDEIDKIFLAKYRPMIGSVSPESLDL